MYNCANDLPRFVMLIVLLVTALVIYVVCLAVLRLLERLLHDPGGRTPFYLTLAILALLTPEMLLGLLWLFQQLKYLTAHLCRM